MLTYFKSIHNTVVISGYIPKTQGYIATEKGNFTLEGDGQLYYTADAGILATESMKSAIEVVVDPQYIKPEIYYSDMLGFKYYVIYGLPALKFVLTTQYLYDGVRYIIPFNVLNLLQFSKYFPRLVHGDFHTMNQLPKSAINMYLLHHKNLNNPQECRLQYNELEIPKVGVNPGLLTFEEKQSLYSFDILDPHWSIQVIN